MAPSGDPLQLSCPASFTQYTSTSGPLPVAYPQPTVSGGVAPVVTTCTPASGGSFSMGTSTVNCSGRDAQAHTAACAFSVTVAPTPHVSATQFVTFGDSITEGKTSVCASLALDDFASLNASLFRAQPRLESGPWAYPRVLESLLRARYASQTVTVVNEGFGGSRVTDELGGASLAEFQRFQNALRMSPQPQVVLLQEGINDVGFHADTADIVKALRDMVREARFRGVQPFLGALLPKVSGACRGGSADAVPLVNEQIHAMADAEGVVYVDLYQAFGSNFTQYIGVDGLHPNPAGYQKIAEVFMSAIQTRLELP